MADSKINDAVRECLDHCKGVPDPHIVAANFLMGLRRRPGWTREEAEQVQNALAVLLPKQR